MKHYVNLLLIEKFIRNELSSEELKEFKKRLKEDADFAQEVKDYMDIHITLKSARQYSIKRMKKKKIRSLRISLIAASFTLIATFVLLVFSNTKRSSHDKLFAQNFTPYPLTNKNTLRTIDTDVSIDTLADEIVLMYEQKKFNKASMLIQQALKEKPKDHKLLFYLGNCYLAMGKTEKAILTFKKILYELEYNSIYTPRAQWYLALCYLKKGNKRLAQKELKKIVESNEYNVEEALILLEDIDTI